MENKLTSGSILKGLIGFSLPFFLSYFLQTLYGLADLYIIGLFSGVASTTAVSIGSQIMHMITVMIVGLAMGTTILIGRGVGAKQEEEVSKIIGTSTILFLILSVAATAIVLFFRAGIVSAMSTPIEAVDGTNAYITVCFLGIPFITAYNVIGSIYRGLGDSKTPMKFVAIACFVNIILDVVFIGPCKMGPAGAALATTLAQTFSVLIAMAALSKKKDQLHIKRTDFRFDLDMVKKILKIGFPISMQDGFIQISFIVITIIVNKRGVVDAAAVGIVEKIICFLFLVPSSLLSAVSTMAAQNIGAKQMERAKRTLYYAILVAVCYGLGITLIMENFAEFFVGMFTTDAVVIMMGAGYMHGYVFDCIMAGIHFCFSGFFCACNKSHLSFIHNIISILFARIPLVYLASMRYKETLFPMGLATTTGSFVSVCICIVMYIVLMQKLNEKALA